MTATADLVRPNVIRVVLAVTLVVPVLFVLLIISGFDLWEPLVPVLIAIVAAYLLACGIDTVIESRMLKIAVVSAAALVSIILGSLLVRSMTMVCDPVHDPGLVCDPVHVPEPTTVPAVITPVIPVETTPMIFDPVHEPGTGGTSPGVVSGATAAIVAEKLDECLRECGKKV